MPLNLLYIKYFCDAVRLQSVTSAAKANFVTQSAVSQGIAKLEISLGVALIARHPNRLRLTAEGEIAFQRMMPILKEVSHFKESFSQETGAMLGDLEFSCPHSFALAIIPHYLKKFKLQHPDVKVNMFCLGEIGEIKQALQNGFIDFGIAPLIHYTVDGFSGLKKRMIYAGNYGLYVSKKITQKEEKKLRFILPAPEDISFLKESYFRKYKQELNASFIVKSWEVVARLTNEGLGIGYFPDYIASQKENLRPSNMRLQLPRYQLCAIYPEGMKLRKSSELFLSLFP